jgi:hypothetical protein
MGSLLLDCLNRQFLVENPELPTPGQFCFRAGEQMSEDIDPVNGEDLCCTGLGWVRIGNAYPSSNFPAPDPVTAKCLPTGWAQEYEVGLLGCYTPGGDPAMAPCEEHTTQAVQDYERIMVLKATACCFGEELKKDPKLAGRLWTVQGINVSGPRSNCLSRVMTLLVQIGKCC